MMAGCHPLCPTRRAGRGAARTVLAATAAAMLATGAMPAAAQIRLSRETAGGDYRLRVMSWWEIPFRSIVRQQYDFSCGSAAVATLLTYHYDRPTSEQESFAWMWRNGNQETIRRVGFSMFEMRNYLNSIGLRAEGYRLTVDQLRRLERPSIALINAGGFRHFVVVKGVRGDRILLGDPIRGLTQYSLSDFQEMWNGIVLAIAENDEIPEPRFDLASDWGPWSRAPMEDVGGIRIAVGDLTSNLPPAYQITPELLLAVRVGTVRE